MTESSVHFANEISIVYSNNAYYSGHKNKEGPMSPLACWWDTRTGCYLKTKPLIAQFCEQWSLYQRFSQPSIFIDRKSYGSVTCLLSRREVVCTLCYG